MALRGSATWPCLSLKALPLGALQGEGTSYAGRAVSGYSSTQVRAEVAPAGVVPAETVRMNRVGGHLGEKTGKSPGPGPLLV